MGEQPDTRPLSTHRTTEIQNKCIQTPMPQVGFKPMILVLVFEQVKTVHTLDRLAEF
jgi:hypothetical protein